MSSSRTITFVTGNANKLREFTAIISSLFPHGQSEANPLPFTISSAKLDLVEIQEKTPEAIAADKCKRAAELVGGEVVTEDTCLCFDSLGGLPGPYIKWFLETLGHQGLNNLLAAYEDKSASALCIFAYSAGPGKEVRTFTGRTKGRIVPARGDNKFGWDPIFEPLSSEGNTNGHTYAEMDRTVKNGLSHRYKAVKELADFLKTTI
ncbi:inosine triphosphate pyrophosphatase-like protein [Gonapodya prolifera JEL478]|uniref:Inosine triphosphate pyrophosphatase n=1 Tax=Gonapodya prolifera (strain JEL478) TaxID=1344416 RepID=A0A139ACA9_GONPJ|nr:inosine triphosphate pyrophosphatase-like protein [Gonapodya prolifera JEL478]|eukprot:KXS14441.1 inosine triphosphate pyrophosphatase-like protein [Gonapodya prolifera JEL478]